MSFTIYAGNLDAGAVVYKEILVGIMEKLMHRQPPDQCRLGFGRTFVLDG